MHEICTRCGARGQGDESLQRTLYAALREWVKLRGHRFPSAELVSAAAFGDVERAATLLRAGADPDSNDGCLTALQRACKARQMRTAQLLLDEGFPNPPFLTTAYEGLAAVHCTVSTPAYPVYSGAALNLPAPGAADNSVSALHIAAHAGPAPLVAMLLTARANVVAGAADGALPIEQVAQLSHPA